MQQRTVATVRRLAFLSEVAGGQGLAQVLSGFQPSLRGKAKGLRRIGQHLRRRGALLAGGQVL